MARGSPGVGLELSWNQPLTALQRNRYQPVAPRPATVTASAVSSRGHSRLPGGRRPDRSLYPVCVTESPTAGTTEADADVPRHRYTADLAGRIERTWQDNWQAWGTFNVPNPVGSLAPADGSAVPSDKVFILDMFPYPAARACTSATRWATSPPTLCPVLPHDRLQRAAHDGLRRVRPPRRAVRGADRHTPADHHRSQHRQHPAPAAPARPRPRRAQPSTTDVDYYRWTQWIFLQIYNAWYDPALEQRPARSPSWSTNSTPDKNSPRRPRWAAAVRGRARRRRRLPPRVPRGLPVNWCRAWARCWPTRRSPPTAAASAATSRSSKRLRQWMMRITAYADRLLDDLERLDWPDKVKAMQRNWIGRSTGAPALFAADGTDIEGSPRARHAVRRDLHGARARTPARRRDHRQRVATMTWTGGGRAVPPH